MDVQPVISAYGMFAPIGLNANQTCHALRAGIVRFQEIDGLFDRGTEPIVGAKVPLERTPEHFHHLLIRPLLDVLSGASAGAGKCPAELRHRPVWITAAIGQPCSAHGDCDLAGLLRAAAVAAGLLEPRVQIVQAGHADAILALVEARKYLAVEPTGLYLIIGADSLLNALRLQRLERAGRLKTTVQPRGLIPGEAGACLLVESESMARRWQRTACRVDGIGIASEPNPVESTAPCLGEGLTAAIAAALKEAHWAREEADVVYSDLNGEVYRAHEWMLARCRTLSSPEVLHPADCLGDSGAAAAPLLLGLAADSLASDRGKAMVFCSSDSGLRGCVCLSPLPS